MIDSQMENSPISSNARSAFELDPSPDLFHSSMYVETIDDIEHPPWASTTSFSESCGSYLSRMSSLCLDSKINDFSESSEVRMVPNHGYEEGAVKPGTSPQCASVPSLEHWKPMNSTNKVCNQKFASSHQQEGDVSGSLQSLASSSKTVYASPRSNSESQFYYPSNKSLLSDKAMQRRGSLYRERAPSENALDFNHAHYLGQSKLSHSLHDVSSIPSNGLKRPCHKSNGGVSTSALCSRNRSRDSGFIYSESMLSLSSGSRNYDHVESKVKQYIQNIKDADALRRKQRADSKSMSISPKQQIEDDLNPEEGPVLVHLLKKMQNEMEEKDHQLLKMQEDYNCLLGKYAEAENKIDRLRFGWCGNMPSFSQENHNSVGSFQAWKNPNQRPASRAFLQGDHQPSSPAEFDDSSLTSSKFLSNLDNFESPGSSQSFNSKNPGCKKGSHGHTKKKEVIISAPLRPISSLYCTSVRLDRIVPPLHSKPTCNASPVSFSCGELSRISSNNTKQKHFLDSRLPDETFREGTTDTGIDDCCLSSAGEFPAKLSLKTEPIEDSISKVQRWQKSLSSPSHPCSAKGSSNQTLASDKLYHQSQKSSHNGVAHKAMNSTELSSVGIQVNLGETIALTSFGSSMPVVPYLNLEGLSGCTGEVSGSTFSSHLEGMVPTLQKSSGSDPSFCKNSAGITHLDISAPSKSSLGNVEASNSENHICEGKCKMCGCKVQLYNNIEHNEVRTQKSGQSFLKVKSSTLIDKKLKMERAQRTISQLSASELAKVISSILKDQDHVVPASPGEQKSFNHAFESLERKMSSLKCSIDLQTFVSLLDLLLEKIASKNCHCHSNSPDKSDGKGDMPQHANVEVPPDPGVSMEDCLLLQCLEEMDEYTNQVWEKTESFLEALDSKKCSLAHKPN